MRSILTAVIVVHGLIHLLGAARGFGLAELPQLGSISRLAGSAWLLAAMLLLAAAAALFAWPDRFWVIGAAALIASQAVIVSAWPVAKFGSLPNLVLLAAVVYGYLTQGPYGFLAQYQRLAQSRLSDRLAPNSPVTEAELAPLPDPLQRYLRSTGVVGQPHVHNYRLRFRGRIRSGPAARWMPFEADQQSFVEPPVRLFLMRARYFGVPIQAFHRLVDGQASMRVRVAGAFGMVDASGPELDRAESVTLFNDMCILAPAALLSPNIAWQTVDARSVQAHFRHGPHTISARLFFDEQGLLRNFVSDDRLRASADAKTMTPQRFSTPVRGYRRFGPFQIGAVAEAHWHPPEGEFAYGEFELLDLAYNVTR